MKLYLDTRPGPDLYLIEDAEVMKSEPELYLDLKKGNDYRDPTVGRFIHGGAIKAKREDMSGIVNDLMDRLPGEELEKEDE